MGYSDIESSLTLNRGTRTYTDDQDQVIVIKYIGAPVSGAVTVAVADATGDIAFVVNGAADTTVATTGTIDVSDSAYNTFGEVVDAINASPNWHAYIKDGMRSETSTDTLLTFAATSAKTSEVILYGDTSVKLSMDMAFTIEDFPDFKEKNPRKADKFQNLLGCIAKVFGISATSTYASGTSKIQVYEVDSAGTETQLYEVASGASTVAGTATNTYGWKPEDKECGYKLVARLINSVAMASVTFAVDGTAINYSRAS